jgi:hypothetical protein
MNYLSMDLIPMVGTIADHVSPLLSSLFNDGHLLVAGSGTVLAMPFATPVVGNTAEVYINRLKMWHGSIADQMSNINMLYNTLSVDPKSSWDIPTGLVPELKSHITTLDALIKLCDTPDGTAKDRADRNTELATTVHLCITTIKYWAFHEYSLGHMTADDIHRMGFVLPGERSGHQSRAAATVAKAEVKAHPISADDVRVVVDQAAEENAGQVEHGWPHGIRLALIVILDKEGTTEIHREVTTRLHNIIRMPEGSRGQMFFVKAAFLKHPNDVPKFSYETSFTMPYLTDDIAKLIKQQQEADLEEHRLEVEKLEGRIKELEGGK